VLAYLDCRQDKRASTSALAFEANAERNLVDLHAELVAGNYRPGRSICFVITRPKAREVWAASFRDRIVHHLLYNHISPRFHARFTADSCACIPGRGTLYAARRLEHQIRSETANWHRPAHYLKCDLANFFVSIDKHVVGRMLARQIREPWWLQLAELVLWHDPRHDVEVRGHAQRLALVPPHKSLFNAPAHCGLPIGNLSSQFFANVLLDPWDHRVKHQLAMPHYVRYVDDFVLVHRSVERLQTALADACTWLPAKLHLQLNPRKTVLQPAARGVDFVGQVIQPWRRSTRRRTVATAVARTRAVAPVDVVATANSYFGLLRQATASHGDRARLARAVLERGHCVAATLVKAYRRNIGE
jgi:RNA-directed DNA polymerase